VWNQIHERELELWRGGHPYTPVHPPRLLLNLASLRASSGGFFASSCTRNDGPLILRSRSVRMPSGTVQAPVTAQPARFSLGICSCANSFRNLFEHPRKFLKRGRMNFFAV